MPTEKPKFALRMEPETQALVRYHYKKDNCRSQNEFIEKAIHFYASYLSAQDATVFLSQVMLQSLAGIVKSSESVLRSQIYKLAVETGLVTRIVGEYESLTPEQVQQKRKGVIDDLNATHGALRLEDEAKRAQQNRLYGRK